MDGKIEIAKGRIKEAAGALTNNNDLRKEGKADQVAGKAKDAIEKIAREADKSAHKIIDKANEKAKAKAK